ncbi:threonyl/alanyl tRNA synthetase SAD [Parageobacillus genomosp. 1]|uniref:Threonyl/alanyl tRNA synthetase SAD n=1 Tax=Parageobacillus genomosp. 1 TaxID=1295642 RepID=A0ABC9VEI3_9BACL|nr:DHHA1 domain-containing protein [Parageobacillus genomosp. 1]EZP76856.1 threonyl/alanyl tRNA synthetase SAD [Parageobacillus genomosp. 1]
MTEKWYYTSPTTSEWTTTVTSAEKDGDTYIVTLAETAFYPEGGGQPCDNGTIAGIPVLEVFEKNEEVYHRLPSLPAASTVRCQIDMARRLDHTQQHSGQHLLSAVCIELFDAHTVGFHMGNEVVTIDLNVPSLSEQALTAIENRANELIYANIPVETYYVTKEEARQLPLRKLPEIEGNIRVVEIKGVDVSACCGTHVSRTGEIGMIKLLRTERHRGMTRLSFVCGKRALTDYQLSHRIVTAASLQLGTNRDMLLDVLDKWEAEKKEMQKQLEQFKEIVFATEAENVAQQAGQEQVVVRVYEQYTLKDIQTIANMIANRYEKTAVLATTLEQRIVIVKAPSLSLHIGKRLKEMLVLSNGKGGGNERQAQAVFPSEEEMRKFLRLLQEDIQKVSVRD